MILDARTVDDGTTIEGDLCIVGGGPAGLSIAHALLGKGHEIVLLEAGGREYNRDDQALYDGAIVGLPYFPLDSTRLRYLGGSSNHWGGWCCPYRDHALEPWPWIPGSGWPIGWDEVDPYALRAAQLIGLPAGGWDTRHWSERLGTTDLPFTPGVFEAFVELIRKMRFADELAPALERDPATRLFLHANLVRIDTDEGARAITGVTARPRENGRTLSVRARRYVLATGGIGNARHLLLTDRFAPGGLGNPHDLVGRYFADHATFHGGVLRPSDPGLDVGFYTRHRLDGFELITELVLPFEVARRERLLRTMMEIRPDYDPRWRGDGMSSLKALGLAVRDHRLPDQLGHHLARIAGDFAAILGLGWSSLRAGQVPIEQLELLTSVAPAPNPDSRVMLDDPVDELGLRRVKLDWRLSPVDKRSARFMLETFAAEAGAAGIGRVRMLMNDDDADFADVAIEPANHHMCTTRMADDPRNGVVDRNCRVHGVDNLYMAGSSVFSTAGDGSPTMMLVALALRLADHLDGLER
jgi:choline dehydrogenase-like flavoprotein